jgi:hypothetical protein
MFRRALAIFASLLVITTASIAPAFALTRQDGDDPGAGLTVLETIGYFVGAPVLLYLVISLIVMGLTTKRGGGVAELDRLPLSDRD